MRYTINTKIKGEIIMSNKENIVDFGTRLKEALKRNQMSQSKLSELTGISNAAISEYISGKYEPSRSRISEFSDILKVNEVWLMGYDVPMEKEALKKEAQKSKTDEIVLTSEQEAELQYIIEHNMLFFKRNKMDEDDAKKLADILREFYIETLE
jgi:transcriptional repressor